MKELAYDSIIIGGGAAGMAAALELDAQGFSCAIIEREDHLGGILMQCIHNGFGLHEFKEELTGPEFAERFIEKVKASNVSVYLNTTVINFSAYEGTRDKGRGTREEGKISNEQLAMSNYYCLQSKSEAIREASKQKSCPLSPVPCPHVYKELSCVSPSGAMIIQTRAVILAMGCREKNRGNVRIPGSRPAGVMTAGLAQRLVNIEGYIPGKEVVVIGSGDIGLIMARRMSWVGCKVKAVVEIQPYPAGLTRNIVQCLKDFDIPLYLSCQTTSIFGNARVEGIEVTPIENGALVPEKAFSIDCDTVLLSVGLVPENELSKTAGVELDSVTNGPSVDFSLMTNIDGVFACGNVLHVHDLVDWVCEEARRAGKHAAEWLKQVSSRTYGTEQLAMQIRTKAGSNVRYVMPSKVAPDRENHIYLRSMIVKQDAVLEVRIGDKIIRTKKERYIQPSEMISVKLGAKDFEGVDVNEDSVLEICIS